MLCKWYEADAPYVKAKYFTGYSQTDASPILGDSPIIETVGYGAFALAAAPAITSFIGGTIEESVDIVNKMRRICYGSHPNFLIPYLNYSGTPVGIDVCKVAETKITPIMDVGVAHKQPGKGQIGAGLSNAPLICFEEACLDVINHV